MRCSWRERPIQIAGPQGLRVRLWARRAWSSGRQSGPAALPSAFQVVWRPGPLVSQHACPSPSMGPPPQGGLRHWTPAAICGHCHPTSGSRTQELRGRRTSHQQDGRGDAPRPPGPGRAGGNEAVCPGEEGLGEPLRGQAGPCPRGRQPGHLAGPRPEPPSCPRELRPRQTTDGTPRAAGGFQKQARSVRAAELSVSFGCGV